MNKIKVAVLEKDYVLQTEENETYVKRLAAEIDRSIREIMVQDSSMSITSACILWAFDAADSNNKLRQECDTLRTQVKQAELVAQQVKENAEVHEHRNVILENENTILRNKLELYSLKEKLDEPAVAPSL